MARFQILTTLAFLQTAISGTAHAAQGCVGSDWDIADQACQDEYGTCAETCNVSFGGGYVYGNCEDGEAFKSEVGYEEMPSDEKESVVVPPVSPDPKLDRTRR